MISWYVCLSVVAKDEGIVASIKMDKQLKIDVDDPSRYIACTQHDDKQCKRLYIKSENNYQTNFHN